MNSCSIDFGPKLQLAATKNGEPESVLGAAIRELAQLNYRYLHMLAREDQNGKIGGQLNRLPESSLLALSESMFSFFTVAFNDSGRWMPFFVDPGHESEPDDSPHDERADFVETVVFFAWHLSCADEIAAKAVLQLDERIAAELRRLPIGKLRTISMRASSLFAPRWIDNDFFWSTLVRCASDPSGAGMQVIKLLGRQLLAAESLGLAGATNSHSNSPSIKVAKHAPKAQVQGKMPLSSRSGTLTRATS